MQAGPSSVRTLGRSWPMPGQCWLSPQDGAGGYSFLSFFYLVIISHVMLCCVISPVILVAFWKLYQLSDKDRYGCLGIGETCSTPKSLITVLTS